MTDNELKMLKDNPGNLKTVQVAVVDPDGDDNEKLVWRIIF